MNITYINGFRFKQAILAGANHVINAQQQINKLNVFPIPDADTGTNMAATLFAIAKGILHHQHNDLYRLSAKAADHAIEGARGNSGTILAQFFQSLSESFSNKRRISMQEFADAVTQAAKCARGALSNPVEGTILSVMTDWASWLSNHWQQCHDFSELLGRSLDHAKQSLKKTTSQLEALSKANVVDAGALGFVIFLEGIYQSIVEQESVIKTLQNPNPLHLDKVPDTLAKTHQAKFHSHTTQDDTHYEAHQVDPQSLHRGDLDFQYCTECIILGEAIPIQAIKSILVEWGNSIVVVGGTSKVKIHIHCNAPEKLFSALVHFGELVGKKSDDMWAQYRHCIGLTKRSSIALVSDSAYSIPQAVLVKNNIHTIPLQILANGKSYLDRVNLSQETFQRFFEDPNIVVTTSQPNISDVEKCIDTLKQHYHSAIILTLSSKFSGTYAALENYARTVKDFKLKIIDTKHIASGQGIVLEQAAKIIAQGVSFKEAITRIEQAITHCHMLISPGTMKFLIRSGRVSKPAGLIANLFRLLPLIGIDKQGKTKKITLSLGVKRSRQALLKEISKRCAHDTNVRFIIAHVDAKEAATHIAKILQKTYQIADLIPVVQAPPVIMTHCGPGTIGVGFINEQQP